MRGVMLSVFCAFTLGIAPGAFAQQDRPTPPPIVDAAAENWQIDGEPLLMEGLVFVPGGPTRFFNGNEMVRTGAYRGIPVYQDITLEPSSVIYVPVAGHQMRPYERVRTGELAGTAGSRTPSSPAPLDPELSDVDFLATVESARPVGTGGFVAPAAAVAPATVAPRRGARTGKSATEGSNGIFIEFDGARWYGSGRPVSFAPSLFVPTGMHSGVVVYKLRTDDENRIWVPIVAGGPLAPYSKR